jgi:hypothetical protein
MCKLSLSYEDSARDVGPYFTNIVLIQESITPLVVRIQALEVLIACQGLLVLVVLPECKLHMRAVRDILSSPPAKDRTHDSM